MVACPVLSRCFHYSRCANFAIATTKMAEAIPRRAVMGAQRYLGLGMVQFGPVVLDSLPLGITSSCGTFRMLLLILAPLPFARLSSSIEPCLRPREAVTSRKVAPLSLWWSHRKAADRASPARRTPTAPAPIFMAPRQRSSSTDPLVAEEMQQ